jgi:hypothetical protein
LEARPQAHRGDHQTVIVAFDFQRIARTDSQSLADGFRQNQAARFVQLDFGIHTWILPLAKSNM